MIVAEILTLAKKVNNYADDATGGGLWVSTTEFRVTCPLNKRWFVLGGNVKRTVASTVIISIKNAANEIIQKLLDEASATTAVSFPESQFFTGTDIIVDAGEYVIMAFGTAQNASAYANCTVLEVDV